jgi:hypothetical protein
MWLEGRKQWDKMECCTRNKRENGPLLSCLRCNNPSPETAAVSAVFLPPVYRFLLLLVALVFLCCFVGARLCLYQF